MIEVKNNFLLYLKQSEVGSPVAECESKKKKERSFGQFCPSNLSRRVAHPSPSTPFKREKESKTTTPSKSKTPIHRRVWE